MTEREEAPISPMAVISGPMRTSRVLAGIGLGAVLMYFLDPRRGARRRARVRDKAARLLRGGERDLFRLTGAAGLPDDSRADGGS